MDLCSAIQGVLRTLLHGNFGRVLWWVLIVRINSQFERNLEFSRKTIISRSKSAAKWVLQSKTEHFESKIGFLGKVPSSWKIRICSFNQILLFIVNSAVWPQTKPTKCVIPLGFSTCSHSIYSLIAHSSVTTLLSWWAVGLLLFALNFIIVRFIYICSRKLNLAHWSNILSSQHKLKCLVTHIHTQSQTHTQAENTEKPFRFDLSSERRWTATATITIGTNV